MSNGEKMLGCGEDKKESQMDKIFSRLKTGVELSSELTSKSASIRELLLGVETPKEAASEQEPPVPGKLGQVELLLERMNRSLRFALDDLGHVLRSIS